MSLRYADRKDVLDVIQANPEGMTSNEVTKALWPDRTGYDYIASLDWTKYQIQNLRKANLIEGSGSRGRSYIWRVKA